ncbi:MAG: T9SS type A sorting domain-containing protein [Fibrobacteria bacterium]|nr:T9SS type A sorting domain-containing protein [Fibrobacteria bacterium]
MSSITKFKKPCFITNHLFILLFFIKAGFSAHFNFSDNMKPFWNCDTMFNESVLMTSTSGGSPLAKLLFPPIEILSVKSSSLDTEFVHEVDWVFEDSVLKLLPGSQAAFLTHEELYPTFSSSMTMSKEGGGLFLIGSGGTYFHERQLAVTYTHGQDVWQGPIPLYQSDKLTTVIGKLKNGQPVKIIYLGDSILRGANHSGQPPGASPFMPNWSFLITDNLKRFYKSSISYRNVSVGGKTSDWGKDNVGTLVTPEKPDLVIIAFGMNDGTFKVSNASYKANIKSMIDHVKTQNPNCEFILVSPTLANNESPFAGTQASYKTVLNELTGEGVVLADITSVHQELLKQKHFRDMTGNNINHPNDFLVRWYAQQVSSLLIPKEQPLLTDKRNVALASFGGQASASSSRDIAYHPSLAINGDRSGYGWGTNMNGGGWEDATDGSFPDWIRIDFGGTQLINEIDVFTIQDNPSAPVEPTADLTFSKWGITDFTLQYLKDSVWADIPNGLVQSNNKVWYKLAFEPLVTTAIRLQINNSLNTRSNIAELEAWGWDAIPGCMDSNYVEYNPRATINDSSCKQSTFVTHHGNSQHIIHSTPQHIFIEVPATTFYSIHITNLTGKTVRTYYGQGKSTYSVKGLQSGAYITRLMLPGHTIIRKILIKL